MIRTQLLSILFATSFALTAQAQLTWGPNGAGGAGTWDSTTANWYDGAQNTTWVSGDTATFSGTGGTVTLNGTQSASQLIFSSTGYNLTGSNISSPSDFSVETDSDATLSINLQLPGNFTKTGSGTLTLSGSYLESSSTSTANINAGTLQISSPGSAGSSTVYNLSNTAGVSLLLNAAPGSTYNIGALSGGGTTGGGVTVGSAAGTSTLNLTNGSASPFTYAGALSDNGSGQLAVTFSNSTLQTLTGANTYSGPTQISGPVTLSGNGTLLSTPITVNGTFTVDNSAVALTDRISDTLPFTMNGGSFIYGGNSTETTGTLTLAGGNSEIEVNDTSVVTFSAVSRAANAGTVDFSGAGFSMITGASNTNGILGAFATFNQADWATVNGSNQIAAFSAYVSDINAAATTDNVELTGGGTTALTNSTTINSLNIQNSTSPNEILDLGTNTLTLASGGLLMSSATNTITIQDGNLTASNGELILNSSTTFASIDANITDSTGPVSVTVTGSGAVSLGGVNTYTGSTTVQGGTLVINSTTALPANTTLAIGPNGSVGLINGATVTGLTGNGGITISAGSLTVNTSSDTSFSGSISLAGGLTIEGTGTQELANQNTYTGTTQVDAGSELLLHEGNGAGPAILASTTPVVLAGGTLALDTPVTGGVTQTVGTLTLQSASTINFANDKQLNLAFSNSSAISWSGNVTIKNFNPAIDKLRFGTSSSGLTSGQLAQFIFTNFNNAQAQIDANGYVTPLLPTAQVSLSNLAQTYDGSPEAATVTTTPSGLSVSVTYNGSATVPTAAGSYSVVATVTDPNYQGSATGTLVISKATASVQLNNLSTTYNGSPQGVSVVTTPSGLSVGVTYNGSSTVPTAAGSYPVVATVNDPNYTGSANGTLVISQATASVQLSNLSVMYNGSPQPATVTTTPSGLTVSVTYNGSTTVPSAIGSYPVVATITDPNYTGSANGTLVISQGTASVMLSNLAASYNGSPQPVTVTTNPTGLSVSVTYNGSTTVPSAVGSYSVVATVTDPHYTGSTSGTLVISQGTATIMLSGLLATYNGSPHAVTATTTPVGLSVTITYNGSTTAPSAVGSYTVVATVNNANYTGSATNTLTINGIPVTVKLGTLAFTYNGSVHATTATTTPAGIPVVITYNGSTTAPSAAGSYPVVATVNKPNYAGSASGTLVISKATASVAITNFSAVYNGSPHTVTVTTSPVGHPVTVTYSGSPTAPTAAGSYTVVATISDPNYQGTSTKTLVISKAPATVTLSNLAVTYNGSPQSPTTVTSPASLAVSYTYSGSSVEPTTAGSYSVVATVSDPNYTGSSSKTFVISKAAATVALSNLTATYNGTAQAVTAVTTPSGLAIKLTYKGSTTAPTNVGTYAVVGAITDPNYVGSATGTLVINKATATVTLGGLSATYTGKGISATATTTPTGLPVTFTYNGKPALPVNIGSYAVVATVNTANAAGTASGTLVIGQGVAVINFTQLAFLKTGSPIPAKAVTVPTGVALTFTYNGSSTPPTNVGDYTVVATVNNPNFTGSNTATMNISQTLPVPTTVSATGIGAVGATLNGNVNPKSAAASVYFQYGPSTAYGSTTSPQSIASGTSVVNFSAALTSLMPATVYHYRAIAVLASDSSAIVFGADKTFTTPAEPLVIATPQASLSASGAEMNFTINPNGIATTVYFQYGTTTAYGSTTALQSLGSGKVAVNVFTLFSNLLPDTLYHYRLVITGSSGTFYGPDMTLTTLDFDTTLVAQKGDAAVGTTTTFASFGTPAINVHDGVAFAGTLTLKSGVTSANDFGIWADNSTPVRTLVAQIGSAAPGTSGFFLTLSDPTYNDDGQVAFLGTLKVATGQATATTATGIWSNSSGSLQLVARQGSAAPGTAGTFASFTSLGLTESGGVVFYGTLNTGTGITSANNAGVWEGNSTSDLHAVLLLGQTVQGETLSTISFQPVLPYVNGQTRNFAPNGDIVCDATFTDGSNGVVTVFGDSPALAITSGVSASFWISGAVFESYGSPTLNNSDLDAFLATLQTGPGGVTAANNQAIFADDAYGGGHMIARTGSAAPGTSANFATLNDPIFNDNEVIAFRGTLQVGSGQATATTAIGIWCDNGDPTMLQLIAQQGSQAPGCPAGATFATLDELALADQGGPNNQGGVIFRGTLNVDTAAGVSTTNNTGIWAVDTSGTLQLIVRTGDVLNGKIITALSFLSSPAYVNGTTRSLVESTGDLVYLATFSDGSTAIFNVVFP